MSVTRAALILVGLAACGCEDPQGRQSDYTFALGTHPNGDPEAFQPLRDGDPVPVVRGGQGALMVVGAVTTDYFAADVDVVNIHVRLEALDGTEYTAYKYRRKVTPGSIYVPEIFLVVEDSAANAGYGWDGTEAMLWVRLETLEGDGVEGQVRVILESDDSPPPL